MSSSNEPSSGSRGGLASLDEVLLILNDHIGQEARASVVVLGAGPDQIVMTGVLSHWLDEAGLPVVAAIVQRRADEVERMMGRRPDVSLEHWRAIYRIGDARVNLEEIELGVDEPKWVVREPELDPEADHTAVIEVQLKLGDGPHGGVWLLIAAGVSYLDEDDDGDDS